MLLIHKCPVGLWSAPLEKLQLLASTSFLYLLSTDLSRFILWIINSFWNWTMEIFFDIALGNWYGSKRRLWVEEHICTCAHLVGAYHLVLLDIIILSKNDCFYSLFFFQDMVSQKNTVSIKSTFILKHKMNTTSWSNSNNKVTRFIYALYGTRKSVFLTHGTD